MIRLVMGMDGTVGSIVASLIPNVRTPDVWGLHTTIGIAEDDELLGGVVYNSLNDWNVEYHCAFTKTPRLTRRVIGCCFAYPFRQLRVKRITTITSAANKRAQRQDEALGFKKEGRARLGFDGVEDAIIYGMLKSECRWLQYAELLETDYIGQQLWAEAEAGKAGGHQLHHSQTQTN